MIKAAQLVIYWSSAIAILLGAKSLTSFFGSRKLDLINDKNKTLLTKIVTAYYNFDAFEKSMQLFKDLMLASLLFTDKKTKDDIAENIKELQQTMLR